MSVFIFFFTVLLLDCSLGRDTVAPCRHSRDRLICQQQRTGSSLDAHRLRSVEPLLASRERRKISMQKCNITYGFEPVDYDTSSEKSVACIGPSLCSNHVVQLGENKDSMRDTR